MISSSKTGRWSYHGTPTSRMGKGQIQQESTCSDQMEGRIVALMSSWKRRRTRRSGAPSIFFVKSKGSPHGLICASVT